MTHSLNRKTLSKRKNALDNLSEIEDITWHISGSYKENRITEKEHTAIQSKPWASETINQVTQLSNFLLKNQQAKAIPEIVALAYWCRKSNLTSIQTEFEKLTSYSKKEHQRSAIGNVFHIAPANVDTVFFYSLLLSVLSGNHNIVRISERSGEICRTLIHLLNGFIAEQQPSEFIKKVSIVEYPATHTKATETFSLWSNLRIIWGGDNAIQTISAIAPETPQLSFPDRYSLAVMRLIEEDEKNIPSIAAKFIADFLPFNQQACSSPKALFWLSTPLELQHKFYQELIKLLAEHQQQFTMSEQVERQINFQTLLLLEHNKITSQQLTPQIALIEVQQIRAEHLINHEGNGLLLTQNINSVDELPFHEKLQTIGYVGLSNTDLSNKELSKNSQFKRFEIIGNALSFQHCWDGVNLLEALTIKA